MEEALRINEFDIGAMIVLAQMDPDFKPEQELFQSEAHAGAFKEITRTPIVRNMYRVGNNVVTQLALDDDLKKLTLVDIGIGSGAQEVKLASQLIENGSHVTDMKVVGIEPMDTMANAAKANLNEDLGVNIDLQIEKTTAQELPDSVVSNIKGKVDVVLATISIHHGDIEDKRKVLETIKKMDPKYFVLSDVNSDHESDLSANSDELATNVRRFYSLAYQFLCEWADQNLPGRDDVKAAFLKFHFDEARNILTRDPDIAVKDYHTTAERWQKLLEEEGFEIQNPKEVANVLQGIENEVHVTDNAIFMNIKEFRELFFSIIAKPKKK